MRLCQKSSTYQTPFAACLNSREQSALQGGLELKRCHLIIGVSMQDEITHGFYDRYKDIAKRWAWCSSGGGGMD